MKGVIYLVGPVKCKSEVRKLPTARQVLQVFFHKHYENHHTIRQSSTGTLHQVVSKWNLGAFRVSEVKNCIRKLEKLFLKCKKLKKSSSRKNSPAQREKEESF